MARCGRRTLSPTLLLRENSPLYLRSVSRKKCRDQWLLYQLSYALDTGAVPDSVAGATIGPLLHARWLTLACRILRKALSTRRPSKPFCKILHFLQNFYVPVWFKVKFSPHIQSGARHFYSMVELSRQLESNSQDIVQKVLRENSYFAHPENILISFLSDTREKVR